MPYIIELRASLLLILFLFLLAPTVLAQSLPERSQNIRLAVESGDTQTALTDLRKLKATDPKVFELNNYDYLMGRLLDRTGDRSASTSSYQSVVARRSLLSQYALWHLAQQSRSMADLVLERERLRQLIISAPASVLFNAATLRLAESFSESKDFAAVIPVLRPLTASKNAAIARPALAMTGEALVKAGRQNEAAEIFNRLLANMPDSSRPDDFALAAVRGLDAISSASNLLSDTDHLRRANIYQFNRDFAGARTHYLAVVDRTADSAGAPEAPYQVGRGFYQQGNYEQALKYLRRVTSSYGDSPSARDALGLIAGTLSRLRQTDEAVNTYKELIERYPTAPNPERPYLNLIDVLRDAGRDDEALSWVKKTRERFKGQMAASLALFSQARIHLAQNSWTAALSELNELDPDSDLGGARVAGGTNRSEVLFLRALTLEQMGRLQEAIDSYLAIPVGRNEYYGWRADAHLRALGSNSNALQILRARADALSVAAKKEWQAGAFEATRRAAQSALRVEFEAGRRRELLDVLRGAYENSPAYKLPSFQLLAQGRSDLITDPATISDASEPGHQALANELLFLGLYDEGTPELAAARQDKNDNKNTPLTPGASANDEAYTFAIFYFRGGSSYPAVRFAEQTWRSIPSDFELELAPRQLIEMLYPAAYRDAMLKYAPPRQLDPRFVLAIARQETRFQADAKSVAAARGLMQFIAATAAETAKELGRREFQQDELYNPDAAVEFGSQYLSRLFRQFPNQPQAVAAAYNGGADNIARWIARSHSQDPDRYVPEIGFAQTKDYVFRVMSNYWVYQQLYDDTLQPK